jgi:hypothetical protein
MAAQTMTRITAGSSPARRVVLARTVRSQFSKVRSVRSTWAPAPVVAGSGTGA